MGQTTKNIPHYTIKRHAVHVRKKELVMLMFGMTGYRVSRGPLEDLSRSLIKLGVVEG